MTPYSRSNAGPFNTTIQLVDTTDVVIGGSSGTANVATKQLADDTAYLYKILGGFENVLQKSNAGPITSVTLGNTDVNRNMIEVTQAVNGYFEVILPSSVTVRAGNIAALRRVVVGHGKPVKISAFSGETIYGKYGSLGSNIYLHDGEVVYMYSLGGSNGWSIIRFEGNLYNVGDQAFGYVQKPGTLSRAGQIVNRDDYPRLWALVSAAGSPLLIPDGTWTSSSDFRGHFSDGNGTTTFRLPDDRGLFDRALDLGANVDADRVASGVGASPGSYEADVFKTHTHGINQTPHNHGITDPQHHHQTLNSLSDTSTSDSGPGDRVATGNDTVEPSGSLSSQTAPASTNITINNAVIGISNQNSGGSETRPVNVGKYPLLVY